MARSPLKRLRSNEGVYRDEGHAAVDEQDPLDFLNSSFSTEQDLSPLAKRAGEPTVDTRITKKGKRAKARRVIRSYTLLTQFQTNANSEIFKAAIESSRQAFVLKHREVFETLLPSRV